jgi:hypothetical protein
MPSLFTGRRMMVLGATGVVAMAVASMMLMRMGKSDDAVDHASVPSATPAHSSRGPTGGPASGSPGSKVVRPADTQPAVPPPMPTADDVFQRRKYTYNSVGRSDPFKSLVASPLNDNRFLGDQIDPEMVRLVGVLEKDGERRALLEDVRGFGYVVRRGDPILRGKIIKVGEDTVTLRHSIYGVTETMTLTLRSNAKVKGEAPHGKRK